VARQASETVTKLLTDIKGKIVSAQESNVDRGKIQTDIDALTGQVNSVVGAAQFNGLNLVNGSQSSVDILASLDRNSTSVTSSSITVNAQDLSTGGYVAKTVFDSVTAGTVSTDADTFVLSLDKNSGTNEITFADDATAAWAVGDKVSMKIGDKTASYTVAASDMGGTNTVSDLVAVGMKSAIDALGITGLTVNYDSGSPGVLSFATGDGTVGNPAAAKDLTFSGQFKNAGSGGLGALSNIDVTTDPTTALASIESMLQISIDAAAQFGSVQSRVDIQSDFVGKLSDALKSGIGSMVDADMEEVSARLQALQVQQQLATQSLSMANQQPQSILSLFR
jgi:flagellin